jgi:hypothetical protein
VVKVRVETKGKSSYCKRNGKAFKKIQATRTKTEGSGLGIKKEAG